MPCITQPTATAETKRLQGLALRRLQAALADGTAKVTIGRTGSVAVQGWNERQGISDLCAYRALAGSPEMRRAILRAEAMTGNRFDPRAVAAGVHSHDGGSTWGVHS